MELSLLYLMVKYIISNLDIFSHHLRDIVIINKLTLIHVMLNNLSYSLTPLSFFTKGCECIADGLTTTSNLCSHSLSPLKLLSSNPAHGVVCSMQYYVIKFVSDLRQVYGFLWVSSTNNTGCHDITEILLKVTLNAMTLTPFFANYYRITAVLKVKTVIISIQ